MIFLKMTYLCFGSLLESIDTGIENRGFFSTHSCFGNTVLYHLPIYDVVDSGNERGGNLLGA